MVRVGFFLSVLHIRSHALCRTHCVPLGYCVVGLLPGLGLFLSVLHIAMHTLCSLRLLCGGDIAAIASGGALPVCCT